MVLAATLTQSSRIQSQSIRTGKRVQSSPVQAQLQSSPAIHPVRYHGVIFALSRRVEDAAERSEAGLELRGVVVSASLQHMLLPFEGDLPSSLSGPPVIHSRSWSESSCKRFIGIQPAIPPRRDTLSQMPSSGMCTLHSTVTRCLGRSSILVSVFLSNAGADLNRIPPVAVTAAHSSRMVRESDDGTITSRVLRGCWSGPMSTRWPCFTSKSHPEPSARRKKLVSR